MSSDTQHNTLPSEGRGPETTLGETAYPHERTGKEFGETLPPPSSGDYPANPTTEHRYGDNIGTGIYDPNSENVAHPSYTISESDFRRTAPDSGQGIHARQYYGPEARSIPVGTTAYAREPSGNRSTVDPMISKTRTTEPETSGGRFERGNIQPDAPRTRYENVAEEPRIHERDVQQERGMGQNLEQEKFPQGKGKNRKQSLSGLFGHGRQRDSPVVDRDADTTDFGDKPSGVAEHGGDRLATSVSERDRLAGTTQGKERLGKEPDSRKLSSSHSASTGPAASTAYAPGSNTASGAGTHGGGTGAQGVGPDKGYDTTSRAGASTIGNEEQRHEVDVKRELSHAKGKPGMMDKIVGKAEVALGKTTGNPGMLAKGEAKAAGLSKN